MTDTYQQNVSHKGQVLDYIPKVLIVAPNTLMHTYRELLAEVEGLELTFVEDTLDDILNNIDGHHALIGCPRHHFSQQVLEKGKGTLQWIHNPGAGVEEFIIPEFVESDVIFTNGAIIQGPECADHALALLLTLTRRIKLVEKGFAYRDLPRPIELKGKTAVVIGLGGIGMCIAERANGFGMEVLAVNGEYIPMIKMVSKVYEPKDLHEALALADVVFMSAPNTKDTRGMLDADAFRAMKKKPYVINVSRGKTIDTDALLVAMREGVIEGCGIDVTDPEPLPDDHPLREFDNAVITPHIAGLSDHNRKRSLQLIKENMIRFVEGRPLINVVNKVLGY